MGLLRHRGALRVAAAVIATGTALGLSACGNHPLIGKTRNGATAQNASLVLDFTPNAIHAGIYTALADGYTAANGVNLKIEVPGESTDAISLLVDHKVTFASLDIHDLAIADAQGKDLVGVMALVERPLAAVIAQPSIRSPRDLDGQTVGVTGDPSDLAVLRSTVAGAGGDVGSIKTVTIGYDAVQDLLAHRVAAATSFWNDEGVELQDERPGYHIFRVEDYGAPAYPELVLCTTRSEIERDPSLVSGTVRALVRGYERVIADPAAGEHALESRVTGLVPAQVAQQLRGEIPAFTPAGGGTVGALEPQILDRWATWEQHFGIVSSRPDVTTMFSRRFVPAS